MAANRATRRAAKRQRAAAVVSRMIEALQADLEAGNVSTLDLDAGGGVVIRNVVEVRWLGATDGP